MRDLAIQLLLTIYFILIGAVSLALCIAHIVIVYALFFLPIAVVVYVIMEVFQ